MEAVNRIGSTIQPIRYHPLVYNGKKAMKNNEIPSKFLPYFKELIAKKEIQVSAINILAGDRETAKLIIDQVETKQFHNEKIKCKIYTRLPVSLFKLVRHFRYILGPLDVNV